MIIPFAVGSYKSPSLPISAQRLVNMYAEKQPPDAKTQVAVFGCPGLVQFASVGTGPIQGMIGMAGTLYVVSAGILYSVTSAGVATALGGTISGNGVVSMATNGTQIVIVNGTNGYIYSTTSGFGLITDTDFQAANTVVFFDQRFVFDKANSNQFFISASLDGSSYEALAIASAEARTDFVKAVALNQQILLVFGERTIEPWQDVGAPNFPFERIPGAVIERGILAPRAYCNADNTVFFIGENRVLYRLDGLSPKRVSNHAIEAEWQTYATVSDAFLFSYFWDGHEFVVVTFPTQSATWVYDVATGMPHERESWDMNNNRLGRWRGNCYINHYDKHLIGDAFSSLIGYVDAAAYTEYGNVMQGIATSPPVHSNRKRVFHEALEIEVESGVGLTTGQGSDPQMMLDYSDDGGRTFSTPQIWRSMGLLGAYRQRLRWLRLGKARQRVYRVTVSDPVKRTILSANADLEEGIN